MITFLFTGQGSQLPWVSRDVLTDPLVAPLLALASDVTGEPIAKLLTTGGRALAHTEVEQPAMVAICLGVHRMLARAGIEPELVMGHSLGELTAWSAAGAITHEDAVRLAALRGRLMAREAERHPGGMVRVIGGHDECQRALAAGREVGSLCITAHNGDEEWVLGGDETALARAVATCRATRLPIAGPWHTPALAGAVDEYRAALGALARSPLRARVIANRDGSVPADDDVIELLVGQLVHPVSWVAMLRTAIARGSTRMLAVGPGKTLRALVQRTLGAHHRVDIIDSASAIA